MITAIKDGEKLRLIYEIQNYPEMMLGLERAIIQEIVNALANKIIQKNGEELIANARDLLLNQNFKDLSEEVTRRLVKTLLKD